jgi:NADPH:quinone reductase-like Zn-dependent oxidoreductase/NAD(P)-dependent dehydrogenase (short-subunit alcohol dehydrogenase family)
MTGEAAGVITAVGSNIGSSWKIGDRVLGLLVAPFGNIVRMNSAGTVSIPDSITFADAASLPIVYYTAWYCLTYVARLEKGQTVLIHAASGGVGQAAIQIAKHIGAEIFATIGSAPKRQLIQDHYGIPDDHIFSSHSKQFKKDILQSTGGKGVDVVLNSLSGELLMESWDCVAPFGTFCEIGKTDIYGRSQLNMANFEKQATFAAVDTSHMYRLRTEFMTRGLREIFDMVDRGILKPVYPVTTYPISQIEDAFRLIAARKHTGKLVLVADENTVVQASRPKAPPLKLYREGTYVIAGGLGDLGKRMGQYLIEHGAGHIVALSRRKVDPEQRKSHEESFSKLGGTLHIVQCDICNVDSAYAAAKEIATLPPVRGVIQSTLVLRDHPLEYMELDDWNISMNPKVWGTRNLDKAFSSADTTDFFVILSSVASIIGSASQSNYAAGNAFQDAFARAHSQGRRGVTHYTTVNVGAVAGSDLIAQALDHGEITNIIGSVSFDEVLATIGYAIGPQARLDKAVQCIMPFDRDSMEEAMGETALSDHLFDHVPSKKNQTGIASNSTSDSKKSSAAQEVEKAETVEDAEIIITQALLDKFAAFIGDDVPANEPVISFGLDSLVSIELKNWIKHTFTTPLQTSELIGAQSVIALAKLIVSRMDLKCKVKVNTDTEDEQMQGGQEKFAAETVPKKVNGETTNGNSHDYDCCKLSNELPDQPLPNLDDALDFWLEANTHLYNPKQLESIQADFNTMRSADGPARQILEQLFETHKNEKNNAWYNDVVTNARYLSSRDPIAPFKSIMGAHRDTKRPHSQAERAAIISASALSFKRAMKAGQVEPLRLAGKPECTWRWGWLFNSVRIPQTGCDKMVRYESNDQSPGEFIAVLRRGHLFKVPLQRSEGEDLSIEELKATFEAIVAEVKDDGIWSGILTTDNRDSWALVSTAKTSNTSYYYILIVPLIDTREAIWPELY